MMIRARLATLALLATAACGPLAAHAESGWAQLNMTPGVTEMSRNIYGLHMLIFWDLRGHRGGRVRRHALLARQVP